MFNAIGKFFRSAANESSKYVAGALLGSLLFLLFSSKDRSISDRWEEIRSSSAWQRGVRLLQTYIVVLGTLIVSTFLFVGITFFLGLEQWGIVGLAFLGITAILIATLYILSYPFTEVLSSLHHILRREEGEESWRGCVNLIRRRIGEVAFILLVLLWVPFRENIEWIPFLVLGAVVTALAGRRWMRMVGRLTVLAVILIVLWPTLISWYNQARPFVEEEILPHEVATEGATNVDYIVAPVEGWSPIVRVPVFYALEWKIWGERCVNVKWRAAFQESWHGPVEACPGQSFWKPTYYPKPKKVAEVVFAAKVEPAIIFINWKFQREEVVIGIGMIILFFLIIFMLLLR